MKKRIVSIVILIVLLVTSVHSTPVNTANAAMQDEIVLSPDNMLDISVVNQGGDIIEGIKMALVDSKGKKVAEWTTGRDSVKITDGSSIRAYNGRNYPVYKKKLVDEASKIIGGKVVKEIVQQPDGGIESRFYTEGDDLSGEYSFSGSTIWDQCVIKYFDDYDTDRTEKLSVEGGKVVTVIDSGYTKGAVRLDDKKFEIAGNQGSKTYSMAPGDYKFNYNRTMTVSGEPTEYVKMHVRLCELSAKFNENGTFSDTSAGNVSFPSDNPDVTSVLSFCSGSVITVAKPDSDGYVDVYVEKNNRNFILHVDVTGGNGIDFNGTMFDKKVVTIKGERISEKGTLLLYVPAGDYTITMSNVPAGYKAKAPESVTVSDSGNIQTKRITLEDKEHTHTGIVHHNRVEPTCSSTGTKEYWTCAGDQCAGKYYSDSGCTTAIDNITVPENPDNHVGGTELKDGVAAECQTNGHKDDTYCLGCGAKIADGKVLPMLGHDMGEFTVSETNADYHCKKCSRCDYVINMGLHNGGEATCIRKAECEICGVTYGNLDDHNHKHTEIRDAKAATKDTKGYTGDKWCTDCDRLIKRGTVIDKLDHTHLMIKTDAKAATHVQDGNIEYYTCSQCGRIYNDEMGTIELTASETIIKATGHSYGNVWKMNADSHWHECSCGSKNDIAAHEFKLVDAQDATEHTGDKVCSICGYTVETDEEVSVTEVVASSETDEEVSEIEVNTPETGDNSNLFIWMALIVLSCGALLGMVMLSKRTK